MPPNQTWGFGRPTMYSLRCRWNSSCAKTTGVRFMQELRMVWLILLNDKFNVEARLKKQEVKSGTFFVGSANR